MAATNDVILNVQGSNFDSWRNMIFENALKYGDAGDSVVHGAIVSHWIPMADDRVRIVDQVKVRNAVVRDLVALVDLTGLTTTAEKNAAKKVVSDMYSDFYNNADRFQFEYDYKRAISKSDKYDEDKSKFLSFILISISAPAKEKLRSHVDFTKCLMAKDVLGMWNIIIGIFGKRGVFSQAISMTKLINLKQNSEPFENFINSFRDTLNALSDAGAPVDPSNATILFLNNINPDPFKNKIFELMSTIPIPTLEDCIKSLSDQLLLRNAMRETNNLMKNLSVKPSKPAAQHETVVNQVESARKPNVSTEPRVNKCFNCDRPGHGTNTCPSAKVTCSNCGKVGHMSKHCESSNRILANFNKKKKSKAERKVNRVEIFDDYFDDNYALTITADDGSLNDEYEDDFVDFDTDNFLMSSDDEFEEGFEYVDFIPDSDYISPTDLFNTPNSICLKNGPSNSADHESVCLIDSGSQENVVNHVDYVSNPTVARSGLSVIGIGGHRTAVTHTGMLKCLPMRALVVPTAKDSVLSLAKIVDIGYSMHCNGKLMEFRNFVSGHSFVARRSDRNFYEVDMLHSSGPSVYHVDKWPIMTGNFSKEQLDRAKGVRKLHVALGHVDDDILEVMLDRNVLVHCTFTSQDVRNAATALGRCQTCIAGKAVESSALPSVSPPANRVGEALYLDVLPYNAITIGGNTCGLIGVDEVSGLLFLISMPNKSSAQIIKAVKQVVSMFNRHGHKVERVIPDAERCLIGTTPILGEYQIQVLPTIPGQHNKRIERHVRTVKDTCRTIRAGLSYILPDKLSGELYQYVISTINLRLSSKSCDKCSIELVQRKKVNLDLVSLYPFGHVCQVQTINIMSTDRDLPRADYGITLGFKIETPNAVKAYLVEKGVVVIRKSSNVHLLHASVTPPEWQWTQQTAARPYTTLPVLDDHSKDDNAHLQTGEPITANYDTPSETHDAAAENEFDDIPSIILPPSDVPVDLHHSAASVSPVNPSLTSNLDLTSNDLSTITPSLISVEPAISIIPPIDVVLSDNSVVEEEVIVPPSIVPIVQEAIPPDIPIEPVQAPTRNLRPNRSNWKEPRPYYSEYVETATYNISIDAALKSEYHEESRLAILDELKNMDDHGAFTAVSYEDISKKNKASIIPSHMFLKNKYDADTGTYERTKARLVAQGNRQKPNTYGQTASKMINTIIVFVILKMMAALDMEASTFDVPGAYLNSPRQHPEQLFIKLSPTLTTLWLSIHPEHRSLVYKGCLYCEIKKAIYGLKDAGFDFYMFLSSFLTDSGYTRSKADDCLFVKFHSWTNFVFIITHVDDILVVGKGLAYIEFGDTIKLKFPDIKQRGGDTITFLGITCKRQRSIFTVILSQYKYIEDLLKRFGMENCKPQPSPYGADFLSESVPNDPYDPHEYLSLVMSLLYLARITRPDILFAVTYLASKSAFPTLGDFLKLKRILRYLAGSMSKAMRMFGTAILLKLFADASHGLHVDGKGHSGLTIFMGNSAVYNKSTKQKCVALSSTESEIISLCDAATYIQWLILLLQDLHLGQTPPISLCQDNTSAVHMVTNGITFRKGKHITIKTHFVKTLLEDGVLKFEYVPTEDMLADMHTKPLATPAFVRLAAHFVVDPMDTHKESVLEI